MTDLRDLVVCGDGTLGSRALNSHSGMETCRSAGIRRTTFGAYGKTVNLS
jgi:hypothetical protein